MFDTHLPIAELLPAIRDHLAADDSLVIEAPPGAGKTTIVPLALLREPWLDRRNIVMLQPRRLAARNAAQRMAELLGEVPGRTIGYRMRGDTRVSAMTRIEVVTEGVLLRMLREDPTLESAGLLIFDEVHERSLESDLGLALALHARDTFADEMTLRIVAMSATLDGEALATLLGAPVLRSEGRLFPVTTHYGAARPPREGIVERLLPVIDAALRDHPESSLLVFLPGQGEIQRLAEQLKPGSAQRSRQQRHLPGDVEVHALYGNLDAGAQRAAIAPCAPGRRKIVLATNIAETSLTIDGIDVVIDSGLARAPRFDPGTGMSRLETLRISQAASEQRAGRAGRLRPGNCYRLWSQSQQAQLASQDQPEIDAADLADVALQLFAWGVKDPRELRWQTVPPRGAWHQALDLLMGLGALAKDETGVNLTAHGRAMADLPLHPRLAHLLLCGQSVGASRQACAIAAVLSERDPVSRETPDMRRRLDYLSGEQNSPGSLRGWCQRSRRLADRLHQQLPDHALASLTRPDADALPGYLIACAYPDRIARRRHSGGYQLANGRSAQFEMSDSLAAQKWLAVAEVGGMAGSRGDRIRSAAPLDTALFESLLSSSTTSATVVNWDTQSGRFIAERQQRCGALILSRERLSEVSSAQRTAALLDLLRGEGLRRLPWNEQARGLLQRARLMETLDPEWPGFGDSALRDELTDWLAPYLAGVQRLSDLKRIDLAGALRARLNWEQQQRLDSWLPQRLAVPSGSKVQVNYAENPPVLAVKLQEMFGCESSPTLAEGRVAVLVHLLSPAGRPLQVTQDLAGFWRSGYATVRKEMKGRYPKHPWPEDPLSAKATRHTRARAGNAIR